MSKGDLVQTFSVRCGGADCRRDAVFDCEYRSTAKKKLKTINWGTWKGKWYCATCLSQVKASPSEQP